MPKLDRGREIAKPRRRRELRAPRRTGTSWPLASTLSVTWHAIRWVMPSRPLDALAVAVALTASGAVIVNALMLQRAPHPAPLFAEAPPAKVQPVALRPQALAPAPAIAAAPTPAPRPAAAAPAAPATKPGLVLDLQRALAERNYYDGVPDGLLGPRTQQAIRNFEQANGLKQTGEPSEALLARVLQARARSEVTGSIPAAKPAPSPSARVFAVQRTLARLGYGPVKYTGLPDAETKSAIERFERDRGLGKTGEIGERLLKELAAVTGAPVE
ncbi:MAG TPA: peptidoglycan-binding protein [Xanthobacteraceae bacterium]|nr:peptidoglycan-binding protein [Xanthobacteraceae bacterium]